MYEEELIELRQPPGSWQDPRIAAFLDTHFEVERWYAVRVWALYAVAFAAMVPVAALLLPALVPSVVGTLGSRLWTLLFAGFVLAWVVETRGRRRRRTLLAVIQPDRVHKIE